MSTVESYGPVRALRQGRVVPLLGRPLMSVRCFAVDGLLVDAGLSSRRADVLAFARAERVGRAVITHHHEDHSGNAAALREAGVPAFASPATAALVARGFALRLYQHLLWGAAPRASLGSVPAIVETERHRFEVLPAPGHCEDQVVLFERAQGWLFSGDAFLASRVKYFRADEDFGESVRSLERLCALPFDALFCAHRPVPRGGREALRRKLERLREIEGQVRALHGRGLPLGQITRRVLGREEWLPYLLTAGDASKRNMVRAILHGPVPRRR